VKLYTRFDFDGVCCAVLLKDLKVIDNISFIHPQELQTGNVKLTKDDVLANVPYGEGCGLWFDHHASEDERLNLKGKFKGASREADSAARVIYDYYDGPNRLSKFDEMMKYVDIADSARFTKDDILNPKGWILLSFICDPRTGLSAYQGYRIPHFQFMNELIERMLDPDIEKILAWPDCKERAEIYFRNSDAFKRFLLENSYRDGPAVITDTRDKSDIPPGNRFLIYSLFPETNIAVRVMDGKGRENVVFSVGHSIINRTSKVNVGSLMLKYGGGGHPMVGTCQAPNPSAHAVLAELLEEIKQQG
jgi:oligoribonuclease NrnB/cAMP/cGMP phosphodiesterase (DHH superfamily)